MSRRHRVCPWWIGPLLCCPLRRIFEQPEKLLSPHVKAGMTVLEPGCGMGYFSLPLARLVGETGHVVCVDMQPQMIRGLEQRARRAGLLERMSTITCTKESLGIDAWRGHIDLAVAIHVVHEVPDPGRLFAELRDALRPGASLLILEPKGHVSAESFDATLTVARDGGFTIDEHSASRRDHGAVMHRS